MSHFSDLSLISTERFKNIPEPQLELYRADLALWEASGTPLSGKPPAVLPFRFPLTNDLPQCIHSRTSQLSYSLSATLYHQNGRHLHTHVLFHPRRYMDADPSALYTYANVGPHCMMPLVHGDGDYSVGPSYWSFDSPVQVYFRLERSVVRLCDPVQIQVHIPSPAEVLVKEKGIKLQNVSATLDRIIQSHPAGQLYSDAALLEYMKQEQSSPTSSSVSQTALSTSASAPALELSTVTTSGKSCRFHSQHAVHLCLALHPSSVLGCSQPSTSAFEPGSTGHSLGGDQICESISQDTALHNIRFVLTIRVVLRGEHGENLDIITRRLIKIMPGPAVILPHAETESISQEKPSSDKHVQESHSMASLFIDAIEYDGYDDSLLSLPTMQPASVVQARLEEMSPPPACSETLPDQHTSMVSCNEEGSTPPDYQNIPPADAESPIPDEELPDFEASMQPPETLPLSLHGWNGASNFTGPPENDPIPLDGILSPSFQTATHLPPSYVDSANTPDTVVSPSTESMPPAYAPRTSTFDPVPSTSDTIFPPLYEV